MEMLTDSELKDLLKSPHSPIKGIDLNCDLDSIDSQIQPCSIDLRINEIFLPVGAVIQDDDSVPRTLRHKLKVGQCAKVSTIERFELHNNFAAILFAPARLSRRGIVVPDIGHIDPGFQGELRMTLINMGRDEYELKHKDTVATVLLLKLHRNCAVGLKDRLGTQPYASGLNDIRHLAPDLLHISRTAKTVAERTAMRALGHSGWRHAFVVYFLPIIGGLLLAIGGYYVQVGHDLEHFENLTEARIESLQKALELRREEAAIQVEQAQSWASINARLDKLQGRIDELQKGPARPEKKP
jgi:dCTP deaminase